MFKYVEYFFRMLNRWLHEPTKVFLFCAIALFLSLIVKGSVFQLWGLHSDYADLTEKTAHLKKLTKEVEMKIERVSDPSYLELEVRKRFDLVDKGDLVFVFSEEG